ncbi:lipopolysaccharide biosynthesis protein [Thiocystis violacea]|uniref:lipopolysaccharide biosynthesis protein n=1 Tax=Thiocystis violacea TaxID=13725 RepID=UPI00190476BC|nr:hypothetical protein [Thiocystis violacea]
MSLHNSRTTSALLTGAAQAIDQFARIFMQAILAPFLIQHMGESSFGLWQWLNRLFANLVMLDGRGAETIKWYIATKQGSSGDNWKQQVYGASLLTLLLYMPLFFSTVFVFFLLKNRSSGTDFDQEFMVVIFILMTFSMITQSVAGLFQGILRGENLGYKRMGVNAGIVVTIGMLMMLLVWRGYGLLGLAVAHFFGSIILFVINYRVAYKILNWLSPKFPQSNLWRGFARDSAWMTAWEFLAQMILAGEIIVLGAFASTSIVTKYYVTAFAPQIVNIGVGLVVSSVMPGLAGVHAGMEKDRFGNLYAELREYTWLIATLLCAALIVINPVFVRSWVGAEKYSGGLENAIIVILSYQLVYVRLAASLLNIALKIREKVLAGACAFSITLLLAYLLVPIYSILGLCIAFLAGRLALIGLLELHSRSADLGSLNIIKTSRKMVRVFLTSSTMLAAYCLSLKMSEMTTLIAISSGIGFSVLIFFLLFLVGWTRETRRLAAIRVEAFKGKLFLRE